MNKKLCLLVVPVIFLGMALIAYGQVPPAVTTKGEVTSASKITISGGIDLDYVYMDKVGMEVATANSWTPGGLATPKKSMDAVLGKFFVRFDVQLSDGVEAVLSLGNNILTDGLQPLAAGEGVEDVLFEYAYIKFKEFYNPNLALTLGIQDFKLDYRGKGNPFFLDVKNSDSAWDHVNSAVPHLTQWIIYDPVGFNLNYKQDPVDFNLFGAIGSEGGTRSADEIVFGANLAYGLSNIGKLGKNSNVNLLLTWFSGGAAGPFSGLDPGDTHEQDVYTIGAGFDLFDIGDVKGLELFAEAYKQFGDAGRLTIAGNQETLDAKGYAFQGGGRYEFQNVTGNPWLEAKYVYISGDDDPTDTDCENFISYEGNNEFLIVENHVLGFDVDTNYSAFKLSGGIDVELQKEKMLHLSILAGFFKFNEEIVGATKEDDLGTEIDFTAVFDYSKSVNFHATFGFLVGADALELFTAEEDNDVKGFVLGTSLRF